MARLPIISKYCVVRFDGAFALALVEGVSHAHAFDRLLRDAIDHLRCQDARRFEDGRHDVDHMVELRADAADVVDVAGPGDGHALPGAAEVRRDLLGPFERRVEGPRPRHRHMRLGLVRTPDVVIFQLICDRNVNGFEGGLVERRADDGAFGARAIVAADEDDQRVVELAHVLYCLNDAANFVIGIGHVRGEDLGLTREKLLFLGSERLPFRKLCTAVFGLPIRPRRELGIRRNHAEPLLVREYLLAQRVPAHVELALELLDPLLAWAGAARARRRGRNRQKRADRAPRRSAP